MPDHVSRTASERSVTPQVNGGDRIVQSLLANAKVSTEEG
jgi:hypothetical protein